MRVEEALHQVRTIQSQLARTQRYCCYRWATVAVSGLLAVVAATAQAVHVPDPLFNLRDYLLLWVGVAAISFGMIAAEILFRWRETQSRHAHRQAFAALAQLAPCLVAGALVTWGIAVASTEHAALLPGLWAVCFSLGVFASAPHLPAGGYAVGAYYLIAGLVSIVVARGDQALAPWTMVITFAVGQSLAAAILYHRKEPQREGGRE